MASLGVRTVDELIGRTDLLDADDAIEHWKARGIDLTHAAAPCPQLARRRAAAPRRAAAAGARRRARLGAARAGARRRSRAASRVAIERDGPQRQPLRRRHPVLARSPRRTAPRACPRTRSRSQLTRLGRPVVRRLAGAGRHASRCTATPTTTPARACRGGVLAVMPPDGVDLPRRGQRDHRQHRPLRRDERQAFFRGLAGERFARAQLGRAARSSRASATTAAST